MCSYESTHSNKSVSLDLTDLQEGNELTHATQNMYIFKTNKPSLFMLKPFI